MDDAPNWIMAACTVLFTARMIWRVFAIEWPEYRKNKLQDNRPQLSGKLPEIYNTSPRRLRMRRIIYNLAGSVLLIAALAWWIYRYLYLP